MILTHMTFRLLVPLLIFSGLQSNLYLMVTLSFLLMEVFTKTGNWFNCISDCGRACIHDFDSQDFPATGTTVDI